MKILHVFKRSFPESIGGVEKSIDTICKSTSKYGIQNKVLSLSTNPSKRIISLDGYDVHHAKEIFYIGSTGFSLDAYFKFIKLASDSDIIHHHYPHPFGDLLQVSSFIKKPYIVTYHSDILRQKNLEILYSPLKNYFLKRSEKIIATSPNYFATSSTLQKHSSKVDIVPIGICESEYELLNQNRLQFWENKLGKNFFLFVGSQRYYKGLNIALEAIKKTTIKLVLAGNMGSNKKLMKYATDQKISNVKFLGEVSHEDKCALLKLCFGFVFPSNLRSEAFGIALLEAALMGKPLISCEIGTGTSFINKHDETGLVVNPGDPKSLKEAMFKLLDKPLMANRMGKNAKVRLKKFFNADKQAKAYFDIYSELLRNKNKSI